MFTRQPHAPEYIALGYWRSDKDATENLPFPSDYVDELWNPAELLFVANYIKRCKPVHYWRGWSSCRLCNEPLGSTCLSDGIYIFPEQFEHYLIEHDVKPPTEFITHVLRSKLND